MSCIRLDRIRTLAFSLNRDRVSGKQLFQSTGILDRGIVDVVSYVCEFVLEFGRIETIRNLFERYRGIVPATKESLNQVEDRTFTVGY